MFTEEEKPLLTGTREEIETFVDCDRCLVVDWQGSEEEIIDDLIHFLPDNSLIYEQSFLETDTMEMIIKFLGREDTISLPFQPQNNFRILLRVWKIIQPDYNIKLFRCTDGSDTLAFLLRSSEWWTSYQKSYPEQYSKVFRDLSKLCKLNKPWWKFWG